VDDHPRRSAALATLLRQVGIRVDQVQTTTDALNQLGSGTYDLIITDMFRRDEGETRAALTLRDELAERSSRIPVVLFTNRQSMGACIPDGFFAYTTDGDTLIQYVIDVMERIEFGVGMRVPRRPRR
jgi:CheY-like chemotaxis protein